MHAPAHKRGMDAWMDGHVLLSLSLSLSCSPGHRGRVKPRAGWLSPVVAGLARKQRNNGEFSRGQRTALSLSLFVSRCLLRKSGL